MSETIAELQTLLDDARAKLKTVPFMSARGGLTEIGQTVDLAIQAVKQVLDMTIEHGQVLSAYVQETDQRLTAMESQIAGLTPYVDEPAAPVAQVQPAAPVAQVEPAAPGVQVEPGPMAI